MTSSRSFDTGIYLQKYGILSPCDIALQKLAKKDNKINVNSYISTIESAERIVIFAFFSNVDLFRFIYLSFVENTPSPK